MTPPLLFIIGLARTGSKLHLDVLEAAQGVCLLDEMHLLAPPWIRRDSWTRIATHHTMEQRIKIQFAGQLPGTYWQPPGLDDRPAATNHVHQLKPYALQSAMEKKPSTPWGLLSAHLELHRERSNSQIVGAKFPVEIGFTLDLMRAFPEAHILHLVRDPRAILSSMIGSDLRVNPTANLATRASIRASRLAFLVSRYRLAARLHQRLGGLRRYHLGRFEDLIVHPQRTIASLCDWTGVPMQPAMSSPRMRGSSYDRTRGDSLRGYGFDDKALTRWRQELPKPLTHAVQVALAGPMQTFGYLDGVDR